MKRSLFFLAECVLTFLSSLLQLEKGEWTFQDYNYYRSNFVQVALRSESWKDESVFQGYVYLILEPCGFKDTFYQHNFEIRNSNISFLKAEILKHF